LPDREFSAQQEIITKEDSQKSQRRSSGRFMREVLESVIIAVLLAVLIKVFLFQNFIIPSESMVPTLQIGDTIYINKLTYKFSDPQRGDVIVFKYPVDPKRDFVKRVIGLPGETVQVKNSKVLVDAKEIDQPYLPQGLKYGDYGPFKIPRGEYFVMGDNRSNSSDSRVWGTLPRENILGKAMFIYWPVKRIMILQ